MLNGGQDDTKLFDGGRSSENGSLFDDGSPNDTKISENGSLFDDGSSSEDGSLSNDSSPTDETKISEVVIDDG